MVGAGNTGLAIVPSGTEIVTGRNRPAFDATGSWRVESSRIARSVSRIAMSTVPTSGMLIGRSTWAAVPSRSTCRSLPLTVTATSIGRSW